jgi:peptidyl-Asp metalloendopeptidase
MRKLALTLTVALVVGGCTSESEVAQSTAQADANSKAVAASLAQASRINTGRTTAYANMPDRGVLLAYDRGQQPLHRGAQVYHAVQLSEAHALNAAAPGKSIELPTPSGGTVRIDYQRHEEGLDGNWSWVGKTQDGLDAVITFGESAVFGRIAQRDTEALRLTMSAGRSWLVESDPSKMLDGNLGRDADESDVLIPSTVAVAASAKKRSTAAAKTAASDEAASAADTVDVVLGFTNGLVTKYGSVANANTRLSNLIAITNQGYQNSLITPRVRLVRTVQVSYTDTNSNEVALEAVTGFTCTTTGCTAQTVPTELVPLRTARDQYGADLVSLVRPFQAPQHQGCGIAWLLGGGGFTIDSSDAPFGYSVVSDGTDVDEGDGRTYFCREETLSHEAGHNMGQQHNIEDAGTPPDTGMHAYSYGYREATTTGFYTVMSYRLPNSSQFSINHFGNPAVNYADTGRPTGTAAADNARSLNLSMPLVAQFRATVVPIGGKTRNDFDGDGKSDLGWWNASGGYFAYWKMNGFNFVSANNYFFGTGTEPTSTGRTTGGAGSEILMRRPADRALLSFRPGTTGQLAFPIGQYADGWVVVGQGDVDGDGKDDLFWRNPTIGSFAYWRMDGSAFLGGQTYATPAAFVLAAVADFNGDGRADILWDAPSGPSMSVWLSVGAGFSVVQIGQYDTAWRVLGAGDVDGDGKADILWRNTSNTYLAYWKMNGGAFVSAAAVPTPTDITFQTTGDYNGDGLIDIIWLRNSDGQVSMWLGNGVNFGGYIIGQSTAAWALVK